MMNKSKSTSSINRHPAVSDWTTKADAIKVALDKRKGEKAGGGLQEARESFCKGVKIMFTLLNDPSFPEDSVKRWEAWCADDFPYHQPMFDSTDIAEFLNFLFEAILQVSLAPLFPQTVVTDGSIDGVRDLEESEVYLVGRVMRAIVCICPIILEGHHPESDRDKEEGQDGRVSSPYITRPWFDLLLTLLEYAEGKGLHHPQATEKIIEMFESLTTYDNLRKCHIWGSDRLSMNARLRLGTLIMESKVAALSLHGLRSLVCSLPITAKDCDSISEARWRHILAAVSTHPMWRATTQRMRRGLKERLGEIHKKPTLQPRTYMHMVNHIHSIDGLDRLQGFPVRLYFIDAGEIVVYLDQYGMRMMDFDVEGREEAFLLHDLPRRMHDVEKGQDMHPNRFDFKLHSFKAGGKVTHIVLEIEEEYADSFEARFRRLVPTTAWRGAITPPQPTDQPSALANDSGDLVPNSSGPPPAYSLMADVNEPRVLDSVEDAEETGAAATHASDSFGLSLGTVNKSGENSTADKAAMETEAVEGVNEVAEKEGEEEDDEQAKVVMPRRATRSSKTDSGGSDRPKPITRAPKSQAKVSDKSTAEAPTEAKSKAAPSSIAIRPIDKEAHDSLTPSKSGADRIPSDPSSSTSSRPSRAAKTRSMKKTTGILSGETVPLTAEVIKAVKRGEKAARPPVEEEGASNESSSVVRPTAEGEEQDEGAEELDSGGEVEEPLPLPPKPAARTNRGKARGVAVTVAPGLVDGKKATGSKSRKEPVEEEEIAEESAASMMKEKEKDLASSDDEEAGEAEDADQPSEIPIVSGKSIRAAVLVPASSQQVPITKPNPVSRSRQRYTRDKPSSTKNDAGPDSEGEVADSDEDDPLDSIVAIPDLPAPSSTTTSKASKIVATTKGKPGFKAPAPAPRVSLRSSRPKETIAGEIKSGRAMTPAMAQAKAKGAARKAESGEKEKLTVQGKEKAVGKGKAATRRSVGPPQAVLVDKAETAPGRIEDISMEFDIEYSPHRAGGGEGEAGNVTDEPVPAIEESAAKKPKSVITHTVTERGEGSLSSITKVVSVEDDPNGHLKPSKKSADGQLLDEDPLPAPPATSKENSKAHLKSPPADRRLVSEVERLSQLVNDDGAIDEIASPFKSALPQQSPIKKNAPSRSRAQAARVSSAVDTDSGMEAAPARSIKQAVVSHGIVSSAEDVQATNEREHTPALEEDSQPPNLPRKASRIPAQSPSDLPVAITAIASFKRKVTEDSLDEITEKRGTPRPTLTSAQRATIGRLTRQAPTPQPALADILRTEVAGPAVTESRTSVPKAKRKVSISEPKLQTRKARKVDGKEGRRVEKLSEHKQAEDAVMIIVDNINEIVKRRVQDRLDIPNKVIAAIERHVSKVACNAVNGFATDHDTTYRSISTEFSSINTKQTDLHKQYSAHAITAKTQQRQVRDVFKLYKRPMEGIPISLFE